MSTHRSVSSGSTDTTGVNTLTLNKPSGVITDDILILAAVVCNVDTAGSWSSVTWPSGFSQAAELGGGAGGYNKLFLATKKAGGSEPSTYDVGYTGPGGGTYRITGAMVARSGHHLTTWVDQTPTTLLASSSTATVVAPSITPTLSPTHLISIYAAFDGNVATTADDLVAPGGQTERVEPNDNNNFTRFMIADEAITGTSATGTRTATLAATGAGLAISLLLREPGTAITGTGSPTADGDTVQGFGGITSPVLKPFISPVTSVRVGATSVSGTGTLG